jgi:hypothetical protein
VIKPRRMGNSLVIEHMEGINRELIKRYSDIVTEFVRRKSGVYALYKGETLYYVGLAKNLKSRLSGHLRDRHADAWDHFNVYLTQGDEHLKELESLVLRIASPAGNRVAGKFTASKDLRRILRQRIVASQKRELENLTSREAPRVSSDSRLRRRRGEFDTIVCPAHREGFEKEFLKRHRWYAVRISRKAIPRLKYIAIYISRPTCQITHYGRIRAIRPWRDSGKQIIYLKDKPKRIGPISPSSKISMQSSRLALLARLKRAQTLADAM